MVEIAMKNAGVHAYIFKFGGTKKERVLKRRLSKSSWAFFWSVIYGRRLVFSFMFRENCTFFPLKKKKTSLQLSPIIRAHYTRPSFSHFNDYESICNTSGFD